MKGILRNLFTISIVILVGCASPVADKNVFSAPVVLYGDDFYIGESSGLYLIQKDGGEGYILNNSPAFSLSMYQDYLYYGTYSLATRRPSMRFITLADIIESQIYRLNPSTLEAEELFRTGDILKNICVHNGRIFCSFSNGERPTDNGLFVISLDKGIRDDLVTSYSKSFCIYLDAGYYIGTREGLSGIYKINLDNHKEDLLYSIPLGTARDLYPSIEGIYFIGYNGNTHDPDFSNRLFLLKWGETQPEDIGPISVNQILYIDDDWIYCEADSSQNSGLVQLLRIDKSTYYMEVLMENIDRAIFVNDLFIIYYSNKDGNPKSAMALYCYDQKSGTTALLKEM